MISTKANGVVIVNTAKATSNHWIISIQCQNFGIEFCFFVDSSVVSIEEKFNQTKIERNMKASSNGRQSIDAQLTKRMQRKLCVAGDLSNVRLCNVNKRQCRSLSRPAMANDNFAEARYKKNTWNLTKITIHCSTI